MIRSVSQLLLIPFSLVTATSVVAQELPIPIAEVQRESEVDFAKEILPVLKKNCLACHHEKEAEGGLILETVDSIHTGGDSGSSVDVADPIMSLLLTRASGEEEPLMPPEDNAVGAKPLTPAELGLLKRWIQEGAKGSEMLVESIDWQEIPETVRTSFAVAMAPTNQFAVVGRGNRTHVIEIKDTKEGETSSDSFSHLIDPSVPGENASHVDLIQTICISPDSQRIATGGFRTVKLWKRNALPLSKSTQQFLNASGIISTNQDQSLAARVNPLGDIEIWSIADGKLQVTLKGHSGSITALSWNTADHLLSADTSGKVMLWKVADGNLQQEIQTAISIHSITHSTDGTQLAAVSVSGHIHRGTIDPANHQISIEPEPVAGIENASSAIFYQSDTPVLVVADTTQTAVLVGADNQIIRKIDHGAPIRTIAVSNSLKQLFTGGNNGVTRSWNLDNGEEIHSFKSNPQNRLLLTYAEQNSKRQTQKVDRLNKQTEELEKRLKSENEVLTKATEEQNKAKTALEEKEKGRADAANAVTATEAAIKMAQDAITAAEKTTADSQKNMTNAMTQSEAFQKELEAEKQRFTIANKEVETLKTSLAEITEKLKQAEVAAEAIKKKVDEKSTLLSDANKRSADAKAQIESSAKIITDSKASIEKGNKDLENQKKALATAEEEKKKGEAELSKRTQAFETSKEAQKRAEAAIPSHKAVIEAEQREMLRLEQELSLNQSKQEGSSQSVLAIAVNEASQQLATIHLDQSVRIFDLKTGQPELSRKGEFDLTNPGQTGLLWVGDELVAFGNQQKTQAWSTRNEWKLERTIGSPDNASLISDRITAMDFRNDGLSLAVGSGAPSRSGEVKVFSVESGRLIRDFGEIHSDSVLGLRFSPRGNMIASSAADKTVRLLDLATGEVTRSLEGHTHHVLAVAWQDDEQTLASASADKTIKIWDIETGEQRRTISGFGKEITAVKYIAATNQLATACADGQARLYDTSNGKSLKSFNANGDFLYSLSLSLDGKQLLASGQSGVLRLWNVEDGKLLQEWK